MTDAAYDRDFYAWTQEQARRLREAKAAGNNAPIDFENLAEEVEDMGSEKANAAQSALERIIEHLLKLEHSPATYPRHGWRKSVVLHRARLSRALERSGSLLGKIDLEDAYTVGRDLAEEGLKRDRRAFSLPETCPYSLDDCRQRGWWPLNRHGLGE